MRVLTLVPGGIGDQLLFFPTLASLRQHFPTAEIDVVVEPRSQGAYRLCPSTQRTIKFDFKGRNSLADFANLLGVLRDREYDLALSLGQRWSARFLLWLTGIPQRISYVGEANYWLTQTVPLNRDQYAAVMYHDLLGALGITQFCPPIRLGIPRSDLDWASAEQERLGIKGRSYILIHGGSSALAQQKGIQKLYPADSWVTVLRSLQEKMPQVPLVLLSGPEDREIVTSVQEALPQILTLSPPDVGKLGAVIANASLLLCTDSAPMHVAVGAGTPLVALFGPTDPTKLLPADPKFRSVRATDGKTMADIPPTQVLERILSE
jgi:ADP-heptose:LPS heptosyltransferase